MMARILAHKPDPGNGAGLHYSRFRQYWTLPVPPNQLLALHAPHENPADRPPIREVGLTANLDPHFATEACCHEWPKMTRCRRNPEMSDRVETLMAMTEDTTTPAKTDK